MTIADMDGLRKAVIFVVPGHEPVIYIPAWAMGRTREQMFAEMIGQLEVWLTGEAAVQRRIGGMVADLLREEVHHG